MDIKKLLIEAGHLKFARTGCVDRKYYGMVDNLHAEIDRRIDNILTKLVDAVHPDHREIIPVLQNLYRDTIVNRPGRIVPSLFPVFATVCGEPIGAHYPTDRVNWELLEEE